MRYEVIFRKEAVEEAAQAAEYLSEHVSMETALSWYAALEQCVASLQSMPNRCEFAREDHRFSGIELRQLRVFSHRLVFVIRGSTVHVLHVRHVARDELKMLGEDVPEE